MLPGTFLPIRAVFRSLYELVYPPVCLGCNSVCEDGSGKICSDCWNTIRPVGTADPLYVEMKERLLAPGFISGLVSAFHFEKDGTLQNLLHQLKYEGMTGIGRALGKKAGFALESYFVPPQISWIVPVPLHPTKRRERGYNQSEFVAEGIGRITGIEVLPSLLQRKKNTRTQTKLNMLERKQNVSEAFAVNEKLAFKVSNASLLLVDDVITTGATIQECARVLKMYGAANIIAASVALADHTAIDSL